MEEKIGLVVGDINVHCKAVSTVFSLLRFRAGKRHS